jgi:polyhydroxyalkanoate synthesis regulator phasin
MFPNLVGQYDQGFDRGRQQLATRLAGQAFTAQPDQQQAALGQLASVDPGTAMQMQGQLAQQAKAQQVDHNAKLNGAARFMLDAVNSKDPARIQGAWSAVSPYLSQLTGKQAPPQWDDAMLPAVYQTIANTGGMPEQKPIQLSSGAQLVDPHTGKVLADNPAEQKDSGEIATIKALQSDPSLLSTYRQMHPNSGSGDSAFEKRIALARGMGASDEQVRSMVLGQAGNIGASDAPLSDGDERMAKALANYQLPAGARFISTKANRAIVQRALEINPQMSTSNYDQAHKFLQDLSSNSPTSAGGVVTAAKTALSHLSDLADLSPKLPSSYGFVNQAENLASSTFNGKNADTLKEWNVAKSKVAAEVLKMVKGGQINESESKEMINDLDPNSPNRDAAIATLAKLMVDKSQAMEDKRDSILGDMSPHTSYLSASDQKKAIKLIGLSKNLEIPQFSQPGGYGQAVPGAPPQAQQPASQPSAGGDFSPLWGN